MAYSVPINITDPVDLLVNVSGQVPILFSGILVLVFFVLVGASYYGQQRRIGKGNISQSFAIASTVTTVGAFILFLIDGLIPIQTVIICVSVTFVSMLWFLFSRDDLSV